MKATNLNMYSKALQLIETGMKMTKEAHLDKQLGWCCEVVKYHLIQNQAKRVQGGLSCDI